MKKLVTLILLVFVCATLTACGPSAKDIADVHPELIGEWGIMFRSEEPDFIIREDGTCMYHGLEGTWSADKEWLDPARFNGDLHLKLEDKSKVDIHFWGHSQADGSKMVVTQRDEYALPDDVNNLLINRDYTYPSAEVLDYIVGHWCAEGENEPCLVIEKNGMLVFEGETGEWCINPAINYIDKTVALNVNLPSGPYSFMITPVENSASDYQSKLAFQHTAIVAYQQGYNSQGSYNLVANGNLGNLDKMKAIELTADNFEDYFEIVETGEWYYDDFNEPTSYVEIMSYRIKNEYADSACYLLTNAAIEVNSITLSYQLTGAVGSEDVHLVPVSGSEEKDTQVINLGFNYGNNDDGFFGSNLYPNYYMNVEYINTDSSNTYISSVDISRVVGTLYLAE